MGFFQNTPKAPYSPVTRVSQALNPTLAVCVNPLLLEPVPSRNLIIFNMITFLGAGSHSIWFLTFDYKK
jgi:hypothetical protein